MSVAPWLDIFLLCHNRPESAKAAIESILAQREDGFRLIVSDNSSDTRVARMVASDFPAARIVQRGCLPALAHFNTCIAEAAADYFCLFHDDDLMGPRFVAEMRRAADRFPDAVALGANAWVVNQESGTRAAGVRAFGPYQVIDSPRELFHRYFGRHQTGIAPFPGYVYRSAVAGGERIPEAGGKYADVTWLLQLTSLGRVVWCNTPLMDYHIHGGNDGLQESPRDRLSFLGFIKRYPACVSPTGLSDYRYFLYKKLVASRAGNPLRAARMRRFLRWQRLRRHLRPADLGAWLRKTLLKLMTRKAA